jgi:Holliday junction resolvase RusA-like endonuclease
MRLYIKPLSVNQAWKGRRFKTDKYEKYELDICAMLPKMDIPDGFLCLSVTFGFSSAASDIDNPLKPLIDCLQKKYGFNDKMIKRLIVDVEQVKKGKEFIDWELSAIEP